MKKALIIFCVLAICLVSGILSSPKLQAGISSYALGEFVHIPGPGANTPFIVFMMTNQNQIGMYVGSGSPLGVVTGAKQGSLYLNLVQGEVWVARPTGDAWAQLLTVVYGNGNPNGVVTGNIGQLYISLGGGAATTLWVKEGGINTNTGWVGK